MVQPKITYPASAPTTTLTFDYANVEKPGPYGINDQDAAGAVAISVSGKKQTMWWRTDQFMTLKLDNVPWSSMAAWQSFIQYAIQGGTFLYYPDSTGSAYDEYYLEESGGSAGKNNNSSADTFSPSSVARQLTGFTLKCRLKLGGLTHA